MTRMVFGIDLGTTYSCIAYVDDTGRPTVIDNAESERTTPSVVMFESEGKRIVGAEAKNNAKLHPNLVVEMVKRQMGVDDWSYTYGSTPYTAELISSYILRKVAQDAAAKIGQPVKDVVITCPAYFKTKQREATKAAGKFANLNVLAIINEPTAAAIAYAVNKSDQDRTVLVYDLGGGTFDITIIDIKAGEILVQATGGDDHLGGRQWDEAIVRYLAEEWKRVTGSANEPLDSPETNQDLLMTAEKAKMSLSSKTSTVVMVSHEGQGASITLTRETFDALTARLLDDTIKLTRETMAVAGAKGVERYDDFLLVGGSTKMPQVQERIRRDFNLEPKIQDPDFAVAKGAAMHGLKLAVDEHIEEELDQRGTTSEDASEQEKEDAQKSAAKEFGLALPAVASMHKLRIINVTSHSFGVIAQYKGEEVVANLVQIQESLPAKKTEPFETLEPNQATVQLRLMENIVAERMVQPKICQQIGEAILELPDNLPKGSEIKVTFHMDEQGLLHAEAVEPKSGKMVAVDIKTTRTMSKEEEEQITKKEQRIMVS